MTFYEQIRIVFCDWLAWMLWVSKPGVQRSFRDLIRKCRKSQHANDAGGIDEEKHDLKVDPARLCILQIFSFGTVDWFPS